MPRDPKVIIDRDLEHCKRCLVIHDLDLIIKESDVKKIIAKALGTDTIKFHVRLDEGRTIHGRQSQCATVTLPDEVLINQIMANRPIRLHNKEVSVSRQIPRSYHLCHQITHGLEVKIQSSNVSLIQIKQIDLVNYFERYGKVNYHEYIGNKAYFLFDDYDTVDQIVLEKYSHRYKGHSLIVEKCRVPNGRCTVPNSDISKYCIHVTNMPSDVSSEELSSIFKVNIENILVRPHNELNDRLVESNRSQVEAWIKEIANERVAQKLATEKTGTDLRGFKIQCQAIHATVDVFDLCKRFQKWKMFFLHWLRSKTYPMC